MTTFRVCCCCLFKRVAEVTFSEDFAGIYHAHALLIISLVGDLRETLETGLALTVFVTKHVEPSNQVFKAQKQSYVMCSGKYHRHADNMTIMMVIIDVANTYHHINRVKQFSSILDALDLKTRGRT